MAGLEMDLEERDSRFLHLLQPARDLASNWGVDVSQALDDYLAQLSLTSLVDDTGHSSLNFTEAALLIQGSSQVYSKKVEYLYSLVFHTLQGCNQKKQGELGDEADQGNEEPVDEDKEEDKWFDLDYLPEELKDIDLVEDWSKRPPPAPVLRCPHALLVDDGDDASGESSDLTKFQIVKSFMYKGWLLLDRSDTKTVDEYLRTSCETGMPETTVASPPNVSQPTPQHYEVPNPGAEQVPNSGVNNPSFNDLENEDADQWQGDLGGEATWEEPSMGVGVGVSSHQGNGAENWDKGVAENVEATKRTEREVVDELVDPWEPLNPHEPGTLTIRPYRQGQPTRKQRVEKKESESNRWEVPMALRQKTSFPEFQRFLQAREREQRAASRLKGASDPTSAYAELRRSFQGGKPGPPGDLDDLDNEFEGADTNYADNEGDIGGLDETYEAHSDDHFLPADNAHEDIDVHADETTNDNNPEGRSVKELCQAHMDEMLQKLADSEVRSALATRVSAWEKSIGVEIRREDARPAFDINVYGDHLLQKLSIAAEESAGDQRLKSFATLVSGQQKSDICRSLAALLQLVNDANVAIERDEVNASECFIKARSFSVKLLNTRRRNENLDHSARAARASPQQQSRKQASSALHVAMLGTNQPQPYRSNVLRDVFDEIGPASRDTTQSGFSSPVSRSPASVRKVTTSKRRPPALSRLGMLESENRVPAKASPSKVTPSKITPEGKKRRKRPPLRTIQVSR